MKAEHNLDGVNPQTVHGVMTFLGFKHFIWLTTKIPPPKKLR